MFETAFESLFSGVFSPSVKRPRSKPAIAAVELVEPRAMLSALTLTVNSISDAANPPAGTVTLRSAIGKANADAANTYTINFAPAIAGQTITLAGTELLITANNLVIQNTNANLVTVDGANISRVFDVAGAAGNNVTISGLKITHGNDTSINGGGGIYNADNLTLINDVIDANTSLIGFGGGIESNGSLFIQHSTVSNNTINPAALVDGAAGLDVGSGTATSIGNTYFGNAGKGGGALYVFAGTLSSTNDTIVNNNGGGLGVNTGASATLINDTIAGNTTAAVTGGGLQVGGTVNAINTLIVGNTANGVANEVTNNGTYNPQNTLDTLGLLQLSDILVVDNLGAPKLALNGAVAGSPLTVALNPLVTNPALVAGSANGLTTINQIGGISAAATTFNVADATFLAVGDQLRIAPVAGNAGGEILTITAIAGNSITVTRGAGATAYANGSAVDLAKDARGIVRKTPVDVGSYDAQVVTPLVTVNAPNAAFTGSAYNQATATVTGLNGAVIANPTITYKYFLNGVPLAQAPTLPGTYSVQAHFASNNPALNSADSLPVNFTINGFAGTTITVDELGDDNDGNITAGNISLREAVLLADASPNVTTINFKAGLNGTITLTNANGGELLVTDSVTIDGTGHAITVSGNNTSRVFDIDDGTAAAQAVTIKGLTITGGTAANALANAGFGGAIYNSEALTLLGDTISNSSAAFGGAGVFTNLSLVSVGNTYSGNTSATGSGAGVMDAFGTLQSTNDTFVGNNAGLNGGGIDVNNGGVATLVNDTITGNKATNGGSGLYIDAISTARLFNSIIAGNPPTGNADDLVTAPGGTLVAGTNNLIGVPAGKLLSDIFAVDNLGNPVLAANGSTGPKTVALNTATTNPARAAGTKLTTLNGAVIAGATTLTVLDATYLVPTQQLRLGTNGETVKIVSIAGNVVTLAAPLANGYASGTAVCVAVDERGIARKSPVDLGAFNTTQVTPVVTLTLAAPNAPGGQYAFTTQPFNGVSSAVVTNGQTTVATLAANPANVKLAYYAGTLTAQQIALAVPLPGAPVLPGTYTVVANYTPSVADAANYTPASSAPKTFTIAGTLININNPTEANLRAAVAQANANSAAGFGPQVINFTTGGTIFLTQGPLNLAGDVTIIGPGAINQAPLALVKGAKAPALVGFAPLVIDGLGKFRIFTVDDGNANVRRNVAIIGITLQNGVSKTTGGAIYNNENLTLTNDVFTGDQAGQYGGAVYNNGWLDSHDNTYGVDNFGNRLPGNSAGLGGGAVYNNGTAASARDTFSYNSAVGLGGAFANAGTAQIVNDTFAYNSVSGGGGAIANWKSLLMSNDTVIQNSATLGGGIFSYPVQGTAGFSTIVVNSIVDGNVTSAGNSVNTAVGFFQAAVVYALNSGLINPNTAAGLFAQNVLLNPALSNLVTLYLATRSPVVAVALLGNTTLSSLLPRTGADLFGVFNTVSSNIIGSTQGWTAGTNTQNFVNTPLTSVFGTATPLLANYGGTTPTFALNTASIARDSALAVLPLNPVTGLPYSTDQRGKARISGLGLDIGAYEYDVQSTNGGI